MPTLYALVDYSNVSGNTPGTKINKRTHDEAIERLVESIVGSIRSDITQVNEARIRLYGGWYGEDSQPTPERDCLRLVIRSPTTLKNIRIFVDPVDALIGFPITDPLVGTYRERRGLTNHRIKTSCHSSDPECTLGVLDFWIRKQKCPRGNYCPIRASDVATKTQQKMVDSMMVADLIALAIEKPHDPIAVVSNDDDIIPGILCAAIRRDDIYLMQPPRENPFCYKSTLQKNGVTILEWR